MLVERSKMRTFCRHTEEIVEVCRSSFVHEWRRVSTTCLLPLCSSPPSAPVFCSVRNRLFIFEMFGRNSRHTLHPWYLTRSLVRFFAAEPAYFQRFPAIAGNQHCWGVVQSVGHLTVNEDGGGSNPPAPAIFIRKQIARGGGYPLAVGSPAETQPFQPPSMDSTFV